MKSTRLLDELLHWIREREHIRINKNVMKKPPPWTNDPILRNNRFCNVRREDDKVTKWIWKFYGLGGGDSDTPREHIQTALTVARMVNWPETLERLGYPTVGWTPEYREHFMEVFSEMRYEGKKAWTGAYMVTGGFSKGGEFKEQIIARVLDGAATRPRIVHGDSLHSAADKIATPGIGDFLSAQIIADLKWTSLLNTADDWYTWCAPGPGSIMGLNFLFDRPRTHYVPNDRFIDEVNQVRGFIQKEAGLLLCAQNTQNCLCELSKYIRAKYFNERLKNSYSPGRTYTL